MAFQRFSRPQVRAGRQRTLKAFWGERLQQNGQRLARQRLSLGRSGCGVRAFGALPTDTRFCYLVSAASC